MKLRATSLLITILCACSGADTGRENTQTYLDGFRPTAVQYASDTFSFYQGVAISPQVPTIATKQAITGCTSSPTLPTGLTLDNTTCKISGTPTTVQTATPYTITAANDIGSLSVQISITVATPPPSNLVYTGSPFAFAKNKTITTVTPTFSSVVTTCTASPALPAGLSLDNTTCAISGAATNSQLQTTHTITASNAFGGTTATIDLTVYRILFVSAAGLSGHQITTSSVADSLCNGDSKNPGFGTYKAMIVGWGTRRACSSGNCATSGAAENLDWVLAPNTEYRRSDATKVMTTNSAGIFAFGALSATLVALPLPGGSATSYWSGMWGNWITQGPSGTCGGNWSTAGGSGAYGLITSTGPAVLFSASASPCSSNSSLFVCAQQ